MTLFGSDLVFKNGHNFKNEHGQPIKKLGRDTRFARFLNGYQNLTPALLCKTEFYAVESYLKRAKSWPEMILT